MPVALCRRTFRCNYVANREVLGLRNVGSPPLPERSDTGRQAVLQGEERQFRIHFGMPRRGVPLLYNAASRAAHSAALSSSGRFTLTWSPGLALK